ncbi:MAG: DNA repair protein RecN [Ghiorsea sp.]|nr:DNA repair protein RecN [Ghiorsea sp.]
MIISLHVRQFALFEHIELELNKGMTVFTGETGAGKSILVDALGAVFGARANADWVRHGAEKAEVIANIESDDPRLLALLEEQGIEAEDGILMRRTITAEGRSRAWVNGTPTSAGLLKSIGNICFDLHGQHEHQTLMQPEFQQQIIDARVSKPVKHAAQKAYIQLSEINKRLHDLHGNRDKALEKETWMRDESSRLLALDIKEGLEDKLEAEGEAGRNIEQVQQAAATALSLFDEQDVTVRNLLGEIIRHVESVAEHHQSLQEAHGLLTQMDALASEVSPYLQEVLSSQVDAESLQQSEDRLADLRAAKRRHGTDEAGLLKLINQWGEALNALDTASWDEEVLLTQQRDFETAYEQAANVLHQARKQAANKLIHDLRPFLDQLGLKNMQLSAHIQARQDKSTWKPDGWDDIELQAAANIGEPFKSLADTASGGELSRLVLALKGCGALENEPDTAIFDEVDVGIGGETGWCVGELLRNMGSDRQVLVVSHLPQVAACAHHQVAIKKVVQDNRTRTNLNLLSHDKRIPEVARMLGGVNEESLSHAATMLQRGQA